MDEMTVPYYAVIFTSSRTADDSEGYAATAQRMEELAAARPEYLGIESVRGADGLGITVSYWRDLESIRAWRNDVEHLAAQRQGRSRWYEWYRIEICQVEAAREFSA